MPNKIIAIDRRFHGYDVAPDDTAVIHVDGDASLDHFVSEVRRICYAAGPANVAPLHVSQPVPILSIIAHGIHQMIGGSCDAGGNNGGTPVLHHIQFCRETIHPGNALALARRIQGCVSDRIRLVVCNAALGATGRQLCTHFAVGAGVRVMAAAATQVAETPFVHSAARGSRPHSVQAGPWEGPVYEFRPNRTVEHLFTGPTCEEGRQRLIDAGYPAQNIDCSY
ncbi:MAG: hypothetical protein AAFV49_21415 [Pseudomonadota bacterium]